jgi:hypothetical protein
LIRSIKRGKEKDMQRYRKEMKHDREIIRDRYITEKETKQIKRKTLTKEQETEGEFQKDKRVK